MIPKRNILSLICGFKCKIVCKSFYRFNKSSLAVVLKLLFVILLTFLIFAPTLHVVYKDIQFSIRYNRNRESTYEHHLRMPDALEDDLMKDYDEFLTNESNANYYANSTMVYNIDSTTDGDLKNCTEFPFLRKFFHEACFRNSVNPICVR